MNGLNGFKAFAVLRAAGVEFRELFITKVFITRFEDYCTRHTRNLEIPRNSLCL